VIRFQVPRRDITITDAQLANSGIYSVSVYLGGVLLARQPQRFTSSRLTWAFSRHHYEPDRILYFTFCHSGCAGGSVRLPVVKGWHRPDQWRPDLRLLNAHADDRRFQLIDTGTYTVSLSLTGAVQATASAVVYVVDQPVIESVTPATSGRR